jgi:hypothetical protein
MLDEVEPMMGMILKQKGNCGDCDWSYFLRDTADPERTKLILYCGAYMKNCEDCYNECKRVNYDS